VEYLHLFWILADIRNIVDIGGAIHTPLIAQKQGTSL